MEYLSERSMKFLFHTKSQFEFLVNGRFINIFRWLFTSDPARKYKESFSFDSLFETQIPFVPTTSGYFPFTRIRQTRGEWRKKCWNFICTFGASNFQHILPLVPFFSTLQETETLFLPFPSLFRIFFIYIGRKLYAANAPAFASKRESTYSRELLFIRIFSTYWKISLNETQWSMQKPLVTVRWIFKGIWKKFNRRV